MVLSTIAQRIETLELEFFRGKEFNSFFFGICITMLPKLKEKNKFIMMA